MQLTDYKTPLIVNWDREREMQRLSSPPTVSLSRAPPAPTGRASEFRNFSAPSSSLLQAPDSTGLQVASGDVFRPYFYALSSISATWSSLNNKQILPPSVDRDSRSSGWYCIRTDRFKSCPKWKFGTAGRLNKVEAWNRLFAWRGRLAREISIPSLASLADDDT
jgi:hypothetical protein